MWYDLNSDTTLHAPLKPIASLALGQLCTRIVKRCQNRFTTRKVIILDCDNTLWGSSVSEVGVNNIILSKEYLWLQSFFTNLQKMGFLLCLCSKNNEEDVLNVFRNRLDLYYDFLNQLWCKILLNFEKSKIKCCMTRIEGKINVF